MHQTLIRLAKRAVALTEVADDLEAQIAAIVEDLAPGLVAAEYGLGALTAAQILLSWSHAGRIRTEAAFAMLSGTAPVPVSSGRTDRHRLNRLGDRQLNRALHTMAVSRMRSHPPTRAYVERRRAEGKTDREIRRCIKRYLARHLYRTLSRNLARILRRLDEHRSVRSRGQPTVLTVTHGQGKLRLICGNAGHRASRTHSQADSASSILVARSQCGGPG